MDRVAKVKGILLSPGETWAQIRDEEISAGEIYLSYAAVLAAIPALAHFIGICFVGISFLTVHFRAPILSGFGSAIASYVLTMITVYLMALIINGLAPRFDSRRDRLGALKLAVFSATPSWIAGVLLVIPVLSQIAALFSLYSFYLLYVGLPIVMETPRSKMSAYLIIVVIIGIIFSVLISSLIALVFPAGRMGVF
jgi:hypothetical protein